MKILYLSFLKMLLLTLSFLGLFPLGAHLEPFGTPGASSCLGR